MEVICSKCRSEYDFDDARVPAPGLRVKCVECGHVFLVARPAEGEAPLAGVAAGSEVAASASPSGLRRAPASAGSPGTAPAASPPAGPRRDWKLRVAPGKVFSFKELTSLQKWIIEGKVSRDAEISLTGEVWKPLGGIPELASFFQVFEAAARAGRPDASRGSSPSGVLSAFASAPSPTPMDAAALSSLAGASEQGRLGVERPAFQSGALPRISESTVRRRMDDRATEAVATELSPVGLGVGVALAGGASVPAPAASGPEFVSSAEVISSPELVPGPDEVLLSSPEDLVSVPGLSLSAPAPRPPRSQSFPEGSTLRAAGAPAPASTAVIAAGTSAIGSEAPQGAAAPAALPSLPPPAQRVDAAVPSGGASFEPTPGGAPAAWSARGPAPGAAPRQTGHPHSWSAHPLEATEEALTAAMQVGRSPWTGRAIVLALVVGLALGVGAAYYWGFRRPADELRERELRAEQLDRERAERAAAAQRAAVAPPATEPGSGGPAAEPGAGGPAPAAVPPSPPAIAPAQVPPPAVVPAPTPAPAAPPAAAPAPTPAPAAVPAPTPAPAAVPAPTPAPAAAPAAGAGPKPAAELAPPKVEVAAGGTGAPGPQIFDWYLKQGDRLRSLDKADKALGMYERALEIDASSAEAFTGRGFALLDLGRGEEALQSFERALSLDPRFGPALVGTAEIYRAQKRPSDALLFYERYLRARPRGPEAGLAQRRVDELRALLQEAE